MSKEEFFDAFKNELGFLPEARLNEAVRRMESYFAGTGDTDKVIESLGGVKGAARYALKKLPHRRCEDEAVKPFPIWAIVIAGVILLPLAVPLAALLIAILWALLSIAVGLIAAATVLSVGMWIGGAVVIMGAFTGGLFFGDTLMQIGIGVMLFGLGIICMTVMLAFYKHVGPKVLQALSKAIDKLLRR